MKILVTGGDGQLGSALKKLAGDYKDYIFTFIDVRDLDLTDSSAMAAFLGTHQPGILINCAAYTAVDKAESETDRAMAVNATAPGEIARICSETGIRLIHISTDYVFDGRSFIPYKETDPVNPVSVYAKSKLEGETRIQKQHVKGIIIRTSWLYSEYGQNFVKTILKKGKELGKLRVVYDQVGGPTYAGDIARVILDIMPEVVNASSMEVYHYANEGVISWYDFANAIIDISGIECILEPVETKAYPTPAARPSYSVFNKTKFKERFGIAIPYWRDSLKECIGNLMESH
ncbi:MAG TPA: dTDP-4-dehydrorhamnose reductase [Bacteroidales bacterium]|nr:dTDP-4-dehydrorhamnose reductase [Bacteroidales bacterium]